MKAAPVAPNLGAASSHGGPFLKGHQRCCSCNRAMIEPKQGAIIPYVATMSLTTETEPASDGALITRFLLNRRWVCGLCDHCRLVMPPATSHSDCSRNDNRASNEEPHVCPPNFTALNVTLPRSGLFRRIERWLTKSASAAVGM